MNTGPDVYLYGQVLGTHSFLLKDGFLNACKNTSLEKRYA